MENSRRLELRGWKREAHPTARSTVYGVSQNAGKASRNGGGKELLTVASFFSGIGGFDLGFERAGFKLTVQCEIDPFCNQVLERHWPNMPRLHDIKEVSHADIPLSTVWTAGFPCQDVSLARARQRAGLDGRHTSLFYEFARLLDDTRPPVVLLENVPGLLSSHRGRDFGIILSTLAELGYGVAWRVLDSQFFGVPQSRRRLYVAGYRGSPARAAEILFERERGAGNPKTSPRAGKRPLSPFKEILGDLSRGPVVQKVGYCLAATSGRHTGTDWSRTYITYPDAVRRITPLEAERLQGFPDGWTIPDGKTSQEIVELDSPRYAALGNAVTVPVAEWIAKRLIRVWQTVPTADETIEALM